MRSELPWSLHNTSKYGSQATFFFENTHSFQADKALNAAQQSDISIIIAEHTLNNKIFIELRFHIKPNQDFLKICAALQIDKIVTTHLLAEQTGEWHKASYSTEPGFAVQNEYALAACGNFGHMAFAGPQHAELQSIAQQMGAKKSDVEIILANIRHRRSSNYTYEETVSYLAGYMYSILFDGSEDNIKLIGLKRRPETANSYDHLFYAKDSMAIFMARTENGLKELFPNANAQHMDDQTATIFTLG